MIPGTLFIIAAPSGAGKTSLVNALVNSLDRIKISVSYTTRNKRAAEQEGVNYHFVSEEKFKKMIAANLLLEYANVYGCYYGTSKEWVETQLKAGTDVILEIDWQGAEQIRKLYPANVSIFILPPSLASLEQRLRSRNQDSSENIARRLEEAQNEISHYAEFDYLLVNEIFDQAVEDLRTIIKAQRLKLSRQQSIHQGVLQELTRQDLRSRI